MICSRLQRIASPLENQRAQGMPGAGWHPRSRVQNALKNAHTSIQVQPEQPGIPCAMVLRLMPRSPWRRIPFASIADGLKACRTRLGSKNLRRLDTSHGCQDHTVLPYAASPVVCALCSLTDQSPPCDHAHAPDAAASTATRPNVRDDGQRPSERDGMR